MDFIHGGGNYTAVVQGGGGILLLSITLTLALTLTLTYECFLFPTGVPTWTSFMEGAIIQLLYRGEERYYC